MKAVPPTRTRRVAAATPRLLESLESRSLLSASFSALNHPHLVSDGAAPTAISLINPLNAPGDLATVDGVNFAYAAHATVLWDNGRLVNASVIAGANNRYFITANGAPASPGAHGLFITFWQTTKSGQVLNRISTGSYAFVDEHTEDGVSFSGLARQTFTGKIGTLGHTPIDDAADGQQTPVTVPTQYTSGPAPEGYTTTFNVSIYWGDGSANSTGTLKKNNDGTWDVWGSHTYATTGTYKILFLLQTTQHYPPGSTIVTLDSVLLPTLTVSTAHIAATTHAADHPFYAFAGQSATATLGRVGLSFEPADIDNSSNLAAGILHYLPPNQTIGKIIEVTINWGDNTSSAAALSVNASGGFDVTGTHTYAKAGGYQISVRAFWTADYSPDHPDQPILIAQPTLYHGETAFTQQAWVGPAPVETGAVLTVGGANTYNGNSRSTGVIRGASGSLHLNLPPVLNNSSGLISLTNAGSITNRPPLTISSGTLNLADTIHAASLHASSDGPELILVTNATQLVLNPDITHNVFTGNLIIPGITVSNGQLVFQNTVILDSTASTDGSTATS